MVLHPAARIEPLPALSGTRAQMVVPRWGCDSIERVPFTSFTRSRMLIRPRPRLSLAASLSKPTPESPHSEMNLVRSSPQLHFEVPYPTVLCGIVESFLEHPVQAERNVRRQGAWQIVALEVNLYFLYLAEFSTEASHGNSKTQIFQF